jgi:hypothetical protein
LQWNRRISRKIKNKSGKPVAAKEVEKVGVKITQGRVAEQTSCNIALGFPFHSDL